MPRANALVTAPVPLQMPVVEETFRRMGTEPPGRAMNDDDPTKDLSEDELLALWIADLF
jgi:hypothetical protein